MQTDMIGRSGNHQSMRFRITSDLETTALTGIGFPCRDGWIDWYLFSAAFVVMGIQSFPDAVQRVIQGDEFLLAVVHLVQTHASVGAQVFVPQSLGAQVVQDITFRHLIQAGGLQAHPENLMTHLIQGLHHRNTAPGARSHTPLAGVEV